MSDEYLLSGYPTNKVLKEVTEVVNGGMIRKITDKVTSGKITQMAGGSEMGVIETVFAEVLARMIIIVILLALAYYGFMYVYEEYLKDFVQTFKSVINKIVEMLKKITDLLGGTVGAAGGILKTATGGASKIPGVDSVTNVFKNLF